MKQKWPILIFSVLLTAFIVLAGIWGNAQFEHLHSGSVLTAQHAVQGIALDGWRQEAPTSGTLLSRWGKTSHPSPSASPTQRYRWPLKASPASSARGSCTHWTSRPARRWSWCSPAAAAPRHG